MQLVSRFYLGEPLFSKTQLAVLQQIIASRLPQWSLGLSVTRHEGEQPVFIGRDDSLHELLLQVAPTNHGLGTAILTGEYDRLSFFLRHSERAFPPESNMLAIESVELFNLEGKTDVVCMKSLFEAIVAQLPTRYGNAWNDEEFRAKNMIDDEVGVEAIGVDIQEAIPGLYWLNYFGAPYVELIGRERLLSAPAFEVKPLGDGVMLAMDQSPDTWQTSDYHDREQAVIAHFGQQYFFSRWDRDRKTIAPDFYSMQQK